MTAQEGAASGGERLTVDDGGAGSPKPPAVNAGNGDSRPDTAEPVTKRGGWWLGPRQRSAVISWTAFSTTFGGVRAVAYAVEHNGGPIGNLHLGGVHVHHYLWAIKLLAASGGLAIHGGDRFRDNPLVAAGYGAGAALVVDEFALLVHLKDVYWKRSGRLSVLLGAGMIAAVGASFTFIPTWHRRRHSGASGVDEAPAALSGPARRTTDAWARLIP